MSHFTSLLSPPPVLCIQQQAHGTGPLRVRQAMGQDEAGAPEHGGETPQCTDVEVSGQPLGIELLKAHGEMHAVILLYISSLHRQ